MLKEIRKTRYQFSSEAKLRTRWAHSCASPQYSISQPHSKYVCSLHLHVINTVSINVQIKTHTIVITNTYVFGFCLSTLLSSFLTNDDKLLTLIKHTSNSQIKLINATNMKKLIPSKDG